MFNPHKIKYGRYKRDVLKIKFIKKDQILFQELSCALFFLDPYSPPTVFKCSLKLSLYMAKRVSSI